MPPQQRIDEHWYQGTADAVYQNIYAIEQERPQYTLILAGDHIYQMNYRKMLGFHRERKADLTVAALPVTPEEATGFGVMQVNDQQRIVGFEEKPTHPKTMPGDEGRCLASMGIYVFTTRFLFEQLLSDATVRESQHDFGKDIIPKIIDSANVLAYPFIDEATNETAYWRDVGTLDAYYEANMDLIHVEPSLNLYDPDWPIRTVQRNLPPPKFVFRSEEGVNRVGMATDSIVCPGSIISGGQLDRCVLGPGVRVNSYAQVSDSILMENVNVGRHAKIRRAIIDKQVTVPEGVEIGFDHEADRARGFTVTPSGITVIGKSGMVRA